jgi:hypothetical protein
MSHTPGPWKQGFVADSEKRPVWTAIESGGFSVATVGRYLHNYNKASRPMREISDAEALANARLIAAAPELLDALKAVLETDRSGENFDITISMVEAAIAKATGGAE